MTKPEGPRRTLVGAPAPGQRPGSESDPGSKNDSGPVPTSPAALAAQAAQAQAHTTPDAAATMKMPQQPALETTVPFGSSALRSALDAALAAGPQAVAAEVARLRQDAASGSSAAIKILEDSGDDLASRVANPTIPPTTVPDVGAVAQDAMRIAAQAATPIEQDPRYRQAQQQYDARYGSNTAQAAPDPRYSNPDYGSNPAARVPPDPRYSNPNYGSNPAAQVPPHHGSNPAAQVPPHYGSNPAAQVPPHYGSNPAQQVYDPGPGTNPNQQRPGTNPNVAVQHNLHYGSNPAAQVPPHYGSNPAQQVYDPGPGTNPNQQRPGTNPNVAVQRAHPGTNPNVAATGPTPLYGSNAAAQLPHHGSNPAAQLPQHDPRYGSNPAAQLPQQQGSNPAAQLPSHDPRHGSNAVQQVYDPGPGTNPNQQRPGTDPNVAMQRAHPGTNPNVAAQRPGTDPNVAVQHDLHYGSNPAAQLPQHDPRYGSNPAAQLPPHDPRYGSNPAAQLPQHDPRYGSNPAAQLPQHDPRYGSNAAAQVPPHYGSNPAQHVPYDPGPGTNPNQQRPGTNPNAVAQRPGTDPNAVAQRPGTDPNVAVQQRPGTDPNVQRPNIVAVSRAHPGTNPNAPHLPAYRPELAATARDAGATAPDTHDGATPAGSAFAVDSELRTLPPDLYEIRGELARGGMGRILRARDVRLGRPVAIKELLGNQPAAQARFEREALITARLQHPAIVPIYEAGRWPTGESFFAMKMVAGRPLDQLIANADTMRKRIALLPNVIAMAEALAYAHSNNVIHRDLKPANVLIGDFGETIVIDWGLAKDLSDTTSNPNDTAGPFRQGPRAGATVAGSVMGTPAYMPPEQGKGQQVDARADVYAIGALLYHVLAKQPPYDGPDAMSVLQKMLAAPPPPLLQVEPDTPPELATIVAKAMARDALDRYPTARELVEDLRRYQNGQMVGVHRYSSKELFKRWAKKHRGALVVAAAAFVLLVGGGIFAITRILDANKDAQHQRDEALANREAAVTALARAEDSEKRAKTSERNVILERDRQRFVRARRIEMDHFKHTQLAKCQQCHLVDPKTFTAKVGAPGHAECVTCHEADRMEGLRDDPKCGYCHLDRKPTTKDQRSLRACDDRAVTALEGAGGHATPCFRHDLKEHRIDDQGRPLECTNCHGVLADKSKWDKSRVFNTLDDLSRFTIIGQGPAGGVDAMHHACTTGCHAHAKHVDQKAAGHNCAMCHPPRDKAAF